MRGRGRECEKERERGVGERVRERGKEGKRECESKESLLCTKLKQKQQEARSAPGNRSVAVLADITVPVGDEKSKGREQKWKIRKKLS